MLLAMSRVWNLSLSGLSLAVFAVVLSACGDDTKSESQEVIYGSVTDITLANTVSDVEATVVVEQVPAAPSFSGEIDLTDSDGYRWRLSLQVDSLPEFVRTVQYSPPGEASIDTGQWGSATLEWENLQTDRPAGYDLSLGVHGLYPTSVCDILAAGQLVQLGSDTYCSLFYSSVSLPSSVGAGETFSQHLDLSSTPWNSAPEGAVATVLDLLGQSPSYIYIEANNYASVYMAQPCPGFETYFSDSFRAEDLMGMWDFNTGAMVACAL